MSFQCLKAVARQSSTSLRQQSLRFASQRQLTTRFAGSARHYVSQSSSRKAVAAPQIDPDVAQHLAEKGANAGVKADPSAMMSPGAGTSIGDAVCVVEVL